MPEPLIHLDQVEKTFTYPTSVTVLDSVSLSIFPEETVAIIGASGEGKSTLLHIIGTLEKPTKGDIFFSGNSIKNMNPNMLRNRYLGFVFQAFYLIENLTLLHNVLLPAKIAKQNTSPSSTAYERACSLIERVGLKQRLNFPMHLLSGGEKQRACIARALMNDPSIILADEPTGNLDHNSSQEVQKLFLECVKTEKKALIVVTHDIQFARLCDRVFTLSSGKLSETTL